jgi:predicted permease
MELRVSKKTKLQLIGASLLLIATILFIVNPIFSYWDATAWIYSLAFLWVIIAFITLGLAIMRRKHRWTKLAALVTVLAFGILLINSVITFIGDFLTFPHLNVWWYYNAIAWIAVIFGVTLVGFLLIARAK